MLTILFEGVATGTLLFVLAVGLSITMGLMRVVNLAHGVFAMIGGYVCAVLLNRWGVPFIVCLPIAFIVAAIVGFVLEKVLYSRIYGASDLDQVLLTLGIVFVATSICDATMGAQQQIIQLPAWLNRQIHVLAGFDIGAYRLFVIVLCGAIALGLHYVLLHTRFGSQLRAAVDNMRIARGLGINVEWIFAATFAGGCGLAGLGGALAINTMGLDPSFAITIIVYCMIVVAGGGTNTIVGPLIAAVLLGICDVAGKYYFPQTGGFIIYVVMVALLTWKPQGILGRTAAR